MRDLLLAARLVRGAGLAGLVRQVLLASGLAVGVLAVLVVAQVPAILGARDAVLAARHPVPVSEGQEPALSAALARSSWAGTTLERVFVAGLRPGAPLPPGVDRLPSPGQVVLSPAAARLAEAGAFALLVPGERIGMIGTAGLAGPDELFAYVGVRSDELVAGRPVFDWGAPYGVAVDGTGQFRFVAVELAVLVLPAATVYLIACGRLASAVRRRRYAALRLAGAGVRTLRRVATWEAGLAAVVGTAAGGLAFVVLNRRVGASGLFGLSWFPEQARIGGWAAVFLVVLAGAGAGVAGRMASRRAVRAALADRRVIEDRPVRWWNLLPGVAGVGVLLPLLPFDGHGYQGLQLQVLLLVGSSLTVLGAFLAAEVGVRAVAGVLAQRSGWLALRLGAAGLLVHGRTAARFVAGLTVVVLVGGVSAGVTGSAIRQAAATDRPFSVIVYGNEVPAAARPHLVGLPGTVAADVVLGSQVEPTSDAGLGPVQQIGVRALVADCAQARVVLDSALTRCRDGQWFRFAGGRSTLVLAPGSRVRFATDDGSVALAAPHDLLVGDSSQTSDVSLVYTGSDLAAEWYFSAVYRFRVADGLDGLDAFSTALARRAPTASANAQLDLTALTAYRTHRAAIRLGVQTAFVLGLLALLVSLTDRSLERRREVAMLRAIGVPARTLRAAQVIFAAVPLLVGGVTSLLAATVIANAFGGLDNPAPRWSAEALRTAAPLWAAGLVAAAVTGLVVVGLRPRPEDLRRE